MYWLLLILSPVVVFVVVVVVSAVVFVEVLGVSVLEVVIVGVVVVAGVVAVVAAIDVPITVADSVIYVIIFKFLGCHKTKLFNINK